MTIPIVNYCFKKHGFHPHWQQDGVDNNCATVKGNLSESQSKFNEENEQDHGFLAFTQD